MAPGHVESEEEEDKWQSRMLMASAEPWVLGFSFELSAYCFQELYSHPREQMGQSVQHMLASRPQLEESVVL